MAAASWGWNASWKACRCSKLGEPTGLSSCTLPAVTPQPAAWRRVRRASSTTCPVQRDYKAQVVRQGPEQMYGEVGEARLRKHLLCHLQGSLCPACAQRLL